MRVVLTEPTEYIRKIATLVYLSDHRSYLGDFIIGICSLVIPLLMLFNLNEPIAPLSSYSSFVFIFIHVMVGIQGGYTLYQNWYWQTPPSVEEVRTNDSISEILLIRIFGINEGCIFHPMVEKHRYIMWVITILLMFANGWGLLATFTLVIYVSKMLAYVKLIDFYQDFLSTLDPEWKGCLRIKF